MLLSWGLNIAPGTVEEPGAPTVQESSTSSAAPARALPPPKGGQLAPTREAEAEAPISPAEAEREAQRQLWAKRLQRARLTLDAYREGTRYPPESRPIREQPDQVYPASPERAQPLSRENRDVQLRMKQEKVFVVGEEVVRFFVGCENGNTRQPLQCEVHSGQAHEAPHMAGAGELNAVPLDFNDMGRNGDEVAGDGTWTASFQPARQGFALFEGTLRIDFKVRATSGGAEGGAFFDIVFTPAPPATFTGTVREGVEQGSLQLYVAMQVRKPGRYVMAGRVDDEAGVPFAYVSFNEELEAGAREVKFTVFGRLLYDEKPEFPLKLRDVEGFLLREQGDPDRELMQALAGYVHTTRKYPLESFSPDEWQSEERQRYLDEFTKDAKEAQDELDKLGGSGTASQLP